MPTLEVAEAADGRVEISFTAVREASAVELTVGEGKLSQVRVDGVEVDSSAGLNSLGIHGLRAGQTVVVTADAAAGTELVAVETSFDPLPGHRMGRTGRGGLPDAALHGGGPHRPALRAARPRAQDPPSGTVPSTS